MKFRTIGVFLALMLMILPMSISIMGNQNEAFILRGVEPVIDVAATSFMLAAIEHDEVFAVSAADAAIQRDNGMPLFNKKVVNHKNGKEGACRSGVFPVAKFGTGISTLMEVEEYGSVRHGLTSVANVSNIAIVSIAAKSPVNKRPFQLLPE